MSWDVEWQRVGGAGPTLSRVPTDAISQDVYSSRKDEMADLIQQAASGEDMTSWERWDEEEAAPAATRVSVHFQHRLRGSFVDIPENVQSTFRELVALRNAKASWIRERFRELGRQAWASPSTTWDSTATSEVDTDLHRTYAQEFPRLFNQFEGILRVGHLKLVVLAQVRNLVRREL